LVASGNFGDAVAMKAFVTAAETVKDEAIFADYRAAVPARLKYSVGNLISNRWAGLIPREPFNRHRR